MIDTSLKAKAGGRQAAVLPCGGPHRPGGMHPLFLDAHHLPQKAGARSCPYPVEWIPQRTHPEAYKKLFSIPNFCLLGVQ